MDQVWITGGTGFFGTHIAKRLGSSVRITTRSEVDLLDRVAVERFLQSGNFKQIVHAAGFVGGMQFMKRQPKRMYDENFRMGENIIKSASEKSGIHLVLIGTGLCYPENAPVPTSESSLFKGELQPDTAAYAQAKLDLLTLAQESPILSFTYLIHTNMFGPGNHLEPERSNVVASLILRAIEAKRDNRETLTVWGTGDETRDFLYVEDAANAVELALKQDCRNEVINVGSGKEISISELAKVVCDTVGFEGKIVYDPSKGGGAARRCLDTSKAEKLLRFKATTSLDDGLKRTYEWIRKRIDLY